MNILRAALGLTAAAILGVTGVGAVHAQPAGPQPTTDPSTRAPLPVPESFFAGAAQALTAPGAELPGANDWSCRPTPDKPRPVILVHGTAGGAVTNWATYGPLLHNEGYCVFTLTYGALPGQPWPFSELGGLSSILEVSMPQVSEFVDRVLEATGADQVDLVGHSQGTLVSGLVAKVDRPGKVHTVASLAPLWDGNGSERMASLESVPGLAEQVNRILPPAMSDLGPESAAFTQLWEGGTPYAPGVRYLNVVTRYDQLVTPYTVGVVAGPLATNVVLQDGCEQNHAEHVAIAADRRAADLVLEALDPAHPRQPRCEAVAPYLGPMALPQLGS
ncbi:triacylglycerol lipase [Dietzia sp. ANT_WB102]|uniref:esterase/lipase family protein n=1 Tax=Dietzia sp. ANT_WB102 TaxID=2597345 RepID=UPI0011EFBB82|nr:alpha/beta hydrolase family protein [Dietzia sp. ANT_WB102]KAA0918660.1 alpha/beta fold hydrolase [Dietzia sp. ANT_WB102]